MAPGPLAQVLRQLPTATDENFLTVDLPFADAGVYRLSDECALVQSIDFFTPIVDDPCSFGRIAAANALSDIYAMGARPLTVLNLIGFPTCLDKDVLVQILHGGAEKASEAGAVVVGGHTVEDDEPKYGMAVTGVIHPKDLITNAGAQPGDRLVLTKTLGTGILATALKGEVISEAQMSDAVQEMETLNKTASEVMQKIGVHACTDITGFGLLGHALELAQASHVGIELSVNKLRVYPQVPELAMIGLIPAGSYRNREHYLPSVVNPKELQPEVIDILADPQTSGGLMISIASKKVAALITQLELSGCAAYEIGQVVSNCPGKMIIAN
ncbi:MAG: selenide, water dikinase SelD [Deltaproteobacteria bacterium]|jgi:selenide,water dikinase|nr:selenide, water dikinase SelD [Deltaproteobacteria bacterium]